MNSKSLGADLVLAYPDADMKIMDANLAASVICEDASLRSQMAAEFDEKANPPRRCGSDCFLCGYEKISDCWL